MEILLQLMLIILYILHPVLWLLKRMQELSQGLQQTNPNWSPLESPNMSSTKVGDASLNATNIPKSQGIRQSNSDSGAAADDNKRLHKLGSLSMTTGEGLSPAQGDKKPKVLFHLVRHAQVSLTQPPSLSSIDISPFFLFSWLTALVGTP
jgi:hypothetical protein